MKPYLLFASVLTIALTSCLGNSEMPEPIVYDDLAIMSTTTPKIIKIGDIVTSKISCQLPNSCYTFSGFQVMEVGNNSLAIRAKGRNIAKEGTPCADVIVPVDTVIKLKPIITGKIILKFYNKETLFKSDTVEVKDAL